ncbi:MAG TPA: SseB family protein [Solirubrobacteraceae bacterium]|nr:SseB family protein [Solirubrobacteraceae bacterium]
MAADPSGTSDRSPALPDRAILTQMLFVPAPEGTSVPEDASGRWQNRSLVLSAVVDPEGRVALPVFTSKDELFRWRGETDFFGLPGVNLLRTFLESDWDRIVVNTASTAAFAIERSEAQDLLDGAVEAADDAPRVSIGAPSAELAGTLVAQLRVTCARLPEIREAYLYRRQVMEAGFESTETDPSDGPALSLLLVYTAATAEDRVNDDVKAILGAAREAAKAQSAAVPPFHIEATHREGTLLSAVRRASSPVVVPADQVHALELDHVPALIGRPGPSRDPPEALVEAVRAVCTACNEVAEAFLYQLALLDRDDGPQLVVALRLRAPTDNEAEGVLVRAVGAAVAPTGWSGEPINVAVIDEARARELRGSAPPIFERA